MKLRSPMTINGRAYPAGAEIPWYSVYPFFLFHMLIFGASGFYMAYADKRPDILFLFAHGGIAIVVYTVFYLAIFGLDEVKWMFINAGLGVVGIYTQVDWMLSFFGKNIAGYPLHAHVIPFLYYTLYTFLIRQAFLDVFRVGENENRRRAVEYLYIGSSLGLSLISWIMGLS